MANFSISSPGEDQARLSTAAAHQRKVRHIQRVVTPTIAYNAAQLAQYNPRLDAGVIGGLSMAGITPDDPVMELVSERAQYEQDVDSGKFDRDAGIFGEWVANPFKGLVRGVFMGLEGLMQEAESAFVRTPVGVMQGKSLGQAFGEAGRSDAYYALNALTQGKRVHAGTGFFQGDQSEDDAYIQEQLATGRSLTDIMASREYAEANAQYGVDVAGLGEAERSQMQITHGPSGKTTPVSLGRLAAIQVFEPGTRQFQMTSGLVDAGKQIFLDPADLMLGGAGKARKLRKLFYTPNELANPNFASKAMQGLKAGLVPGGSRKTILARTVDQWMDSNQGRGLIDFIAEQEGADGARTLYELFGQKRKGTLDPNFIRNLTETDDVGEIRSLLKQANESGSMINVPKMPGTYQHIKTGLNGTILGRLAAVTPGKMINIEDGGDALYQLDNYTLNLGLTQAQRDDILYRALQINAEDTVKYGGVEASDQDLYSQYFQLVKDATTQWVDNMEIPMDDPLRTAMTKIFDSPDVHRSFWVDNMGNDVMFGGANVTTTIDGKVVAAPSAVMFSQFLNQGIPLMDAKKIRSAARRDWIGRNFINRDGAEAGELSKGQEWLMKKFGNEDWDAVGNNAVVRAMDWSMSKLWKPSVLLRVAWPMRVIGEEQLRLSGKLMAGSFNHPLQYMALMATKDKGFLGKIARMGNDVHLNDLADDAHYEASMSSRNASVAEGLTGKKNGIGGRGIRYEAAAKEQLSDRELSQAYVFELNQVRNNELSVIVAEALTPTLDEATGGFDISALDDIKARFFGGDLDYLRRQMLRDQGRWQLLNDRAYADGYIDTIYAKTAHLSGAKGFLLDPGTGRWRSFDGEELSPMQLRERMGMGAQGPEAPATPLRQMFGEEGANEAMEGAQETLINELGQGEGSRIFGQMEDTWDRVFDETQNVDQATTEALQLGDDMVEQSRGAGGTAPQMGDREFIPTFEAQTGIGEWAERPSFTGAYQSNKLRQLTDETNQHWMGDLEDAAEMGGLMKLGEGHFRDVDEFIGMPATTVQLADEWDDVFEAYGRAYARWEDGKAVAGITVLVDPDTQKVVGVAYTGGLDMPELTKLQRELVDSDVISLEDVLKFNAGDLPFDEWLRTQGVDVRGMSREEIWTYLDENPDILRKFEGHTTDAGDWVPGTNPRIGVTSTTRAGGVFTRRGVQEAREASSEWPQHMPYFQVEEAGDPRIFELVATGKITDTEGATLLDWGTKRATTGKAVRKQFDGRQRYFEGDIEHWREKAPGFLRRPQTTNEAKDIGRWDEAVDVMMQTLMSKPTDKLSRSPAFRQFYWKRAAAMAANLTEPERVKFLEAAGKANLLEASQGNTGMGKAMRAVRRFSGRENTVDEALRYVKNIEGQKALGEVGGPTTLAELDEVAKAYALQETKNLLYDMTKSHNLADVMRLMIPFGEAWFEVGSTWAKLMTENPRNIRRMQQGIEGARGSNPFQDTGPDGEQGRGFFFNDPSTGDEVFAFPGLGLIPDWMPFIGGAGEVGDQHELVGRAAGLNLVAQVMPGIGPILQIPMSHMGWTDDVDKKWIRDVLMPFGKSPVEGGDPTTWISPILPTWVNKAFQSFGVGGEGNERLYANTVIDVYKTLLMQGWSDDTPEDMAKTLDHAKGLAGDITRIRALSNFAAPTAGANLWEVTYTPEDQDGEIWAYSNLATAYRQILDESQGDEVQAFKSFQDIFGLDPMLFAVSKTQKVLPRAVTLEARKWQQDNEDLFQDEAYPYTAYFAAPDPAEGEFDYESYLLQLKEDTRVPLTPEQWGLKRNQFLGRIAYSNFQRTADRRFQDQNQKTLWLRNTFSGLQQLFPGYGQNIVGMPAKPTLDMQMRELARWGGEERLANTEAGQALNEYLSFRQSIINLTQAKLGYTSDTGFRTGKQSAVYRRQLRARGQKLVAENPMFLPMWQQILSRELEEPESTMAPVNIAGVGF